ncbi:LicD family protein [Veillonella magna]|uniref:LicD family protein n=1 Tax=Veillonella magna TaxID=464322 RepID=UPI0023F383D1|nr:LicD family protein [Veillonella magna]MBD8975121.1 LicD family protein [Veillonella magna]
MLKNNKIFLSQREIKKYELQILLYFQKFCQSNNLRFYLSGGTLLGAIRHKGFIPWDDDIDVCMPRKDYEKLLEMYNNNNEQYQLRSVSLGNFTAPYAKMVDTNTQVESQYTEDENNSHLWVDIFPVDGLPEDLYEVEKIYSKCSLYRQFFVLADAKLGEGKSSFRRYAKYLLKPLAKLYGKTRCVKHIERIAQHYSYENSKYVGAITWGLYGAGERMLKSEFAHTVMVEFEGHQFPTFSCWDSYLKGLYGDYMKLPPVEKRQTHDMKVYIKEESD